MREWSHEQEPFVDQGQQRYEEQQRQRNVVALGRRAASLGFKKTLKNLLSQNKHSLKNKELIEVRCDKNEVIQTFLNITPIQAAA